MITDAELDRLKSLFEPHERPMLAEALIELASRARPEGFAFKSDSHALEWHYPNAACRYCVVETIEWVAAEIRNMAVLARIRVLARAHGKPRKETASREQAEPEAELELAV